MAKEIKENQIPEPDEAADPTLFWKVHLFILFRMGDDFYSETDNMQNVSILGLHKKGIEIIAWTKKVHSYFRLVSKDLLYFQLTLKPDFVI